MFLCGKDFSFLENGKIWIMFEKLHNIKWRKIVIAGLALMIAFLFSFPIFTQTMLWSGNFLPITLSDITTRDGIVEGSSTTTLQLTGDVDLSADNTNNARLSEAGGDFLVTEYKMTFDGNGVLDSGAAPVNYTTYNSFLNPSITITHIGGDDYVDVTLYVQASNQTGNLANAASYSAAQTITVSWVGP